MIASSAANPSHSAHTSICSDDQIIGQPSSLYQQHSHGSVDPNNMATSRMSSLPSYVESPSFASDAGSQPSIQLNEASLYAEPVPHGFSPESSILTTRNGNTFKFPSMRNTTSTDKVRVLKHPRVRRRPKTTKVDKISTLNITAPLSQLTQHMVHIPVKDMEAWVNRPTDVRRREVAQKNGKIARPMNSFMLYRSAYAERTKEWCSQNNHQVVSRVSGQSWPKEPPEIREKYELLALLERDNHQKAHPEYKFAPNKNQTPPRKKRPFDGEDGSDVDESGYQPPSNASPGAHKTIKASGMKSEYDSRESTPYDGHDIFIPESYPHSQWSVSVGQSIPPRLMAAPDHHHHHHHNPHHQPHGYYMNGNGHGSFQNMFRPSDNTSAAARQGGYVMNGGYSTSTGLTGIPGSINQDLLRPYGSSSSSNSSATIVTNASNVSSSSNNHSSGHAGTRMDDSQLDPQLLSSHQAGIDMRQYNHVNLSSLWHPSQSMGTYIPITSSMVTNGVSYDILTASYAGMQPIEEGQQGWGQVEDDGIAVPEVGKDFDQWIHSQNPHQSVYGQQ